MNSLEIKKIRNSLGLNQSKFGKMLGVSMRAVQTWESGERNMPESTMLLLNKIIDTQNVSNKHTPTNEANYLIKSLEDKEKIIKLLEGTITMQEQLNKMQEKINENATVNYHTSITLTDFRDEMKAFCSKIDKKLNQIS